jgi:hypothetical protein
MQPAHFLKQAFVAAFSLYSTFIFSQTILKVTENNLHGWAKDEQGSGKIRFTGGPAKPPQGNGSLEFAAPINSHARHVRMRNNRYSGILMSSITALGYSTYVQQAGSTRDVPLLVLLLDLDGDGRAIANDSAITHLFFIPRFQDPMDTTGLATKFGWYKPKVKRDKVLKSQFPIRQHLWQTWDAAQGGWCNWTLSRNTVDTNPTLYSLSGFVAQYPNARIINDKNGGGVRLQAGGIAMADNFLGNVDAFVIGINGKTVIFDFELDSDTPSVLIQLPASQSIHKPQRHGYTRKPPRERKR